MSRLRMSCHNLRIETGRYLAKTSNSSRPTACSNGMVDDEIHFVTDYGITRIIGTFCTTLFQRKKSITA